MSGFNWLKIGTGVVVLQTLQRTFRVDDMPGNAVTVLKLILLHGVS
jgi:hypothetical protein